MASERSFRCLRHRARAERLHLHAAIDAWSRGDWGTAFENAAPDLEFDNTRNLGEWRAVRTTPAQVRRDWETFTELWESVSIEVRM